MNTAEIAARLRAFVRAHASGACKQPSLGDACRCALCDIDRLAGALVVAGYRVTYHNGSTYLCAHERYAQQIVAKMGTNPQYAARYEPVYTLEAR